jgi:hypothetical protein
MPKTKKVEEAPDKKEEAVDYTEVHDTKAEDLVGKPTDEKEEKPVETPEEKDEKPDFDPDKFAETVSEKAAEKTAKMIEEVTGRKEPTKEVDEELMSPWAKENRTPRDYEEVADWALQKKSILDKREAEAKDAQSKIEKEETEKQNEEKIKNFNRYVDEQLDELHAAGKIDKNNKEQRKALFTAMLEVNQARAKEGKQPIYSVKEIFYEHYKVPTSQPAGADAPVSMGGFTPPEDKSEINYNDIHNSRGFEDVYLKK